MVFATDDRPTRLGLIWCAAAIAHFIERATFHLLESGMLPARKVGGRWCANPAELEQHVLTNNVGPTDA